MRPPPPAPTLLPLRREGCGVHQALPSSPRRSTPLRPQVVILDFLDTFSSRSRRWCHHFWLYFPFLRSDLWRAVCVVGGTGEGVACRRGRRAHFCVVGDVSFVSSLSYQTHTTLVHTPGYQQPRHAASTTLLTNAVKRHSQLTLRHKTPVLCGLGDSCTRRFR